MQRKSASLRDLTVALETAGASQHDVKSEEADGVVDIKGLSLRSLPPLVDQHPGCIIVNLDVGISAGCQNGRLG